MRYMITDGVWEAMEPLVRQAQRHKGGQPPVLPERMFFEAVLYIARTGTPWRDLPEQFGAWDAVSQRFRRRVASGAMARTFEALTADPQFGAVRRVLVDSTNVRAHRHAAGAARKAKRLGAAASARRQGLGRSRGGLTSKIVVTAADESTAIAVDVRPGQAHDAPLLEPMLDRTIERVVVFDELVGDKGFDGDGRRGAWINRNVFPNIPNKRNRVDPWGFLPEGYVERNRVARQLGKLKQFRRGATRYEKLKETFLGLIHLALGVIRIKASQDLNTT